MPRSCHAPLPCWPWEGDLKITHTVLCSVTMPPKAYVPEALFPPLRVLLALPPAIRHPSRILEASIPLFPTCARSGVGSGCVAQLVTAGVIQSSIPRNSSDPNSLASRHAACERYGLSRGYCMYVHGAQGTVGTGLLGVRYGTNTSHRLHPYPS